MKNPTTLRTMTLRNRDSATATLLCEPGAEEKDPPGGGPRGELTSSSSSEDSAVTDFLLRMMVNRERAAATRKERKRWPASAIAKGPTESRRAVPLPMRQPTSDPPVF